MLQLEAVPAFEDNYIWTVHDGHSALLVDPGEAAPILAWLTDRRMQPVAVLITHRHGDHVGGLPQLKSRYPDLAVHGPAGISGVTEPAGEGHICGVAKLGLDLAVLATPGHTREHLAFFGHGWLFCGDTLFSCGCGRAFDGRPDQLHASLVSLATLPADTLMCCAHEYTLDNLRFAIHVDPDNAGLRDWRDRAAALRDAGQPTLPTRLGDEVRLNPFLRCHEPALQQRIQHLRGDTIYADDTAVFVAMRALKDHLDHNPDQYMPPKH